MQTKSGPRQRIVQRARMRMLFRQAVARIDGVAQAEGLSPAQYHVLLAMAARAGEEGLAETDLVRYLEASRAHVSVLVRGLETAGLVRDWRDTEDRRQVRLAVTDAGWELLERLGSRQEEVLREFVTAIDPAEVEGIVAEISTRYLGLRSAS
jgi:MarR family transcriptional regulator, organic hydroperoxide resistance regulator